MVITVDDAKTVKHLFTRYLNGSGHPMHQNLGHDVISDTVRECDKDDDLMCSRHLLAMVTGTELLPSNTLQKIWVSSNLIDLFPMDFLQTKGYPQRQN